MSKAERLAVELSLAVEQTLQGLMDEIRALNELASDLGDRLTEVLVQVHTEVAIAVAENAGDQQEARQDEYARVLAHVIESETKPAQTTIAVPGRERLEPTEAGDANRIRATPFTRAPRSTQVKWLLEVMADGDWHTPPEIGRRYADDERHFRYLRHAIGGRFREMHEDGLVERRDSQVKGAMFEYRLKKGAS